MRPNILLTSVSVIALMAVLPAYAQENTSPVAQAVSQGAQDIDAATKNAYEDIKAAYIDSNEKNDISTITIDQRRTATKMIGDTIVNTKNEKVGLIHDIIVDKSGNALMVILSDSDWFGMGKQVAFEYKIVTAMNEGGDVIAQLNETMIKNAKAFSYNAADKSNTVSVMPEDGYSVSKLLNGQLVNQDKETIAEIDNMTFRNGKINWIVVTFDQTMGMGGNTVAMPYSDTTLIADSKEYDLQLSQALAARFESYKKSAK